jgi:uncharacterized protein YbbC (DUF1343 family)
MNKAIKLYRDLLRTIKKSYTKNVHQTIKKEIRHHFDGNKLHNCETKKDIAKGYKIIEIIKENTIKRAP